MNKIFSKRFFLFLGDNSSTCSCFLYSWGTFNLISSFPLHCSVLTRLHPWGKYPIYRGDLYEHNSHTWSSRRLREEQKKTGPERMNKVSNRNQPLYKLFDTMKVTLWTHNSQTGFNESIPTVLLVPHCQRTHFIMQKRQGVNHIIVRHTGIQDQKKVQMPRCPKNYTRHLCLSGLLWPMLKIQQNNCGTFPCRWSVIMKKITLCVTRTCWFVSSESHCQLQVAWNVETGGLLSLWESASRTIITSANSLRKERI